MTSREPQRFLPRGLLALEPQAFGFLFSIPEPPKNEYRDNVAIVSVQGPLMHHPDLFFDSYDDIVARVADAISSKPRAIILKIDSPGGVVSGAFEAAQAIIDKAAAASVPVLALVEGAATSAAYALACAAERIAVSGTSVLGSIGIISALLDRTKMNESLGLKYTLVTSGRRKADGHPDTPISEEAIASVQESVDGFAKAFFAFVAGRRNLKSDEVEALDARTMLGAEAVTSGLADELGSLDSLLAAAGGNQHLEAAMADTDKNEEARKALRAVIEDENSDEKAKARARKALAAMDEEEDSDAKGEDEEDTDAKGEDDKEAKVEDEETVSAKSAGAAMTTLSARVAELEKDREDRERAELFASRPDLDAELVKVLKKMPLADAKAIVKATKKATPKPAAAASTVPATRGAGQGTGLASGLPPDEAAAMDAAMGLTKTTQGVKKEGNTLFLGASLPVSNPNPPQGK